MKTSLHQNLQFTRRGLTRRSFLHSVSATSVAAGCLSLRDVMSLQAAELRKQGKKVIVLWMQGGPSQFETFDPKSDSEIAGETTSIQTAIPGVEIAHAWPETAKALDKATIIRSMTSKEGNHQRATYQMHTGYLPSGSVKHPGLGANLATHLEQPDFDLPSVVSIGRPASGLHAGHLGIDYEPFVVDRPGEMPRNVEQSVETDRYDRRRKLLGRVDAEFAKQGAGQVVADHQKLYGKAARMVLSQNLAAFNLDEESSSLRNSYGDTDFGRGCLLSRRLVETGVPYVEVNHRNWDTHADVFENTTRLAGEVDPALATLLVDLETRGMLDDTLVVWMGEFGRTPRINPRTGRDHFPRAFNALLAGAGVRGGQVIGSTTKDGAMVDEQPVTTGDLFTSICHALDVDPTSETISPLGRPMKIVDEGSVVDGLFG
ncbi:MAG: DUF1501 domain-containing protein [Planctomycetaceae bacterium]|nr:DUF1501 domain-containing protein [Planctomycetaceae bacterium]